MTSEFIINALLGRHLPERKRVAVREMRCGCGFGPSERRMDLWVIQAEPAKGCPATAYEVKVSRQDFVRDRLKAAEKHRGALMYSDRFYYAAPEGLINPDELPPFAGLIEVRERGGLRIRVPAPVRSKMVADWPFIVSLFRREERGEGEETPLLRRVASAASDYLKGTHDGEFAEACGGLPELRGSLFDAVNGWEEWHDSQGQ